MRPAIPQRTDDSFMVAPDPHDGPRDDMSRRHRNPRDRIEHKRGGSGRFGRKTAHRLELGDPHPQGLHDPPPAKGRAESHGDVAQEQHPERNVGGVPQHIRCRENAPDNACRFLGIIAAMPETV